MSSIICVVSISYIFKTHKAKLGIPFCVYINVNTERKFWKDIEQPNFSFPPEGGNGTFISFNYFLNFL